MNVDFDIKKVLIPVDFSDPSRAAFYAGLHMASRLGAEVVVLHVKEWLPGREFSAEEVERLASDLQRLEEGVRRRVDELLEGGTVDEATRRTLKVEIRGGKPWVEVVRYAWDNDVDLIVMATHGYTGVKHILIGSTAERVVRRAHCPVLCVKPAGYDPNIEGIPERFRRV